MSSLSRREFLQMLAAASAAGMGLGCSNGAGAGRSTTPGNLYEVAPFGNVSLLHFTDCHAQLKPIYFREPSINIGIGGSAGKAPHLVGEALLKTFKIAPGSIEAHAFTYLNFDEAARQYGKVGGFAHLATLVKSLRDQRKGRTLLLDGGDTWQGSGTALWTKGQDMVDACKLLGVDIMTGHWEFTYGAERVKEIVDKHLKGSIEFLAQNVNDATWGESVFKPYVIRELNGVQVAIIGQAFPYTPIANPRWMVPDWSFGINDDSMQKMVDKARAEGAKVVVVLSHNGMDVDLKMASRVTGIDAILGGHTHDGVPAPTVVPNKSGKTLVCNSGSNGKYPVGAGSRGQGRQGHRLPLQAAAGVLQPDRAGRQNGGLHREGARAVQGQARGETRGHRGRALPARQLQRHLRPADRGRHDRGAGRGYRVLARLPLGHVAAAG